MPKPSASLSWPSSLVFALSKQPKVGKMPKDVGSPFCRIDYVWRDDLPDHLDFWKFISKCAVFPMAQVVCDTELGRL